MDILARTNGPGGPRDGEYVVLELKRPDLPRADVAKAFAQAIGYAAGLMIESNDLLVQPRDVSACQHYRNLFTATRRKSTGRTYKAPLIAHAVVVLPDDDKIVERAKQQLDKLALHERPSVDPHLRSMGVGVLLYRTEGVKRARVLDPNPGAFSWLTDHALGWRPN